MSKDRDSGKTDKSYAGFSAEERKAMQLRVRELELEAEAGKLKGKAKLEKEHHDKIAEMPEPDRAIAERIYALVRGNAPELSHRTMYGLQANTNRADRVICFFQAEAKG